jgi:hypothetical protein
MHKKEKERLDGLFVWSIPHDIRKYNGKEKIVLHDTTGVHVFFFNSLSLKRHFFQRNDPFYLSVYVWIDLLTKRTRLIPYNKVEREKVFCFFLLLDKYWIREIEDIVNKVRKRTRRFFLSIELFDFNYHWILSFYIKGNRWILSLSL